MVRIAIVGGGVSGLSLAYHLEQRLPGAEVLLLESAPRLGGTIQTREVDGFRVECGPNGFLDNKPGTLDLARAVGLNEQLLPASEAAGKNRFLFLRGRLRKLPSGLFSFLFSTVLSWRAKWALLTERRRRTTPPEGDESVAAFATRRTNAEIAETLADAFVSGIHAGDSTRLSVRAAFPRLAAFEREYGSVSKGFGESRKLTGRTKMWSFRHGMGSLIDALRERLRTPPITGVNIRAVLARTGHPSGYRVLGDGHDFWEADRVVLACPAYRQAELLADLDAPLADEIAGIPYNRIVVAALFYPRSAVTIPLDGFGYLTPGREKRDVLGVQWCSSIFPGQRAPKDMVLLRAMCGGWHRPEMADWSDDKLLTALRRELAVTMKIDTAPTGHHLVRWDRAIPQYNIGHLERVARIDTAVVRHPGLYLSGNAYRGVALNDCTENAALLAEQIAKDSRE